MNVEAAARLVSRFWYHKHTGPHVDDVEAMRRALDDVAKLDALTESDSPTITERRITADLSIIEHADGTPAPTETVALLRMSVGSRAGAMAFNLDTPGAWDRLIEEIDDQIDGIYDDGWIDYMPPDATPPDPQISVEIRRMPKGWTEAQPEHPGW